MKNYEQRWKETANGELVNEGVGRINEHKHKHQKKSASSELGDWN